MKKDDMAGYVQAKRTAPAGNDMPPVAPNPARIHAMARMAMLEKREGELIAQVRDSYKSDFVSRRVLRSIFCITALLLLAAVLVFFFSPELLTNAVAQGQIGALMAAAGLIWLISCVLAGAIAAGTASERYRSGEQLRRSMEQIARRLYPEEDEG